jgi:hypothetical protein
MVVLKWLVLSLVDIVSSPPRPLLCLCVAIQHLYAVTIDLSSTSYPVLRLASIHLVMVCLSYLLHAAESPICDTALLTFQSLTPTQKPLALHCYQCRRVKTSFG